MNRVPRLYIAPSGFVDSTVRPGDEAAHYLNRVLRLRAGDRWAALDGLGRSWLCEVVDKQTSRRIDDWPAVPPLPIAIEVGLALCKGSRFEDAIEKLAELGAHRLVPLQTERTERGLPSPAKSQRWSQIAHSGSALANRLVPMSMGPSQNLESYLQELDPASAVYCHPDGAAPREVFQSAGTAYTLLIGPEGGFSPQELEALEGKARPVSLGPLTLRVETAAVSAVVLALAYSSSA